MRVTQMESGQLTGLAPAKLNLGLRVFPVRPDGFHDLETWMVPISWYDTLWVQANENPESQNMNPKSSNAESHAANVQDLTLEVIGRAEGVPTDIEKNLVGRAALKLAAAAGIRPQARIKLQKVLPPGGGLGGGSSDAATALLLLNELWGLNLTEEALVKLGAELGSDVPVFVRGQGSMCTGRGEIMKPMRAHNPLFAVLIIPPQGCPTRDVFAAFDAGHQHQPPFPPSPWPDHASATAEQVSQLLVNDLEPAAFHVAPWLAELRTLVERIAGRKVRMTGSGSTLFVLCGSGVDAGAMRTKLMRDIGQTGVGGVECIAARILA